MASSLSQNSCNADFSKSTGGNEGRECTSIGQISECAKTKPCKECRFFYDASEFPKKDGKRQESRCKQCFNRNRRERRAAKNGKKKKNLVLSETKISDQSFNAWASTLVQILIAFRDKKSGQHDSAMVEVMTLLCGDKNGIEELLKKKGA